MRAGHPFILSPLSLRPSPFYGNSSTLEGDLDTLGFYQNKSKLKLISLAMAL